MFRCYSYTIIRECINLCNCNTETCRSCFNVNFNVNLSTVTKRKLCVSSAWFSFYTSRSITRFLGFAHCLASKRRIKVFRYVNPFTSSGERVDTFTTTNLSPDLSSDGWNRTICCNVASILTKFRNQRLPKFRKIPETAKVLLSKQRPT